MAYKPRFGSKQREALHQREALAAHKAGRGPHPICVHCNLPVTPGQAWDESHITVPAAFGGKDVGVGHRRCNQLDNNQVVTPMAAKARRARLDHVGVTGPGLGRHALPGGRRAAVSKTMRGQVVPRLTLSEKLAVLRAKRAFCTTEIPT